MGYISIILSIIQFVLIIKFVNYNKELKSKLENMENIEEENNNNDDIIGG